MQVECACTESQAYKHLSNNTMYQAKCITIKLLNNACGFGVEIFPLTLVIICK